LEVLSNRLRIRGGPPRESDRSSIDPNHRTVRSKRIDPGTDQRFPCHEKEGDAQHQDQCPTYLSRLGTDLKEVPE
jgi:hypothetical protein